MGSCTFLKTPSLYLMVMEVLPTAAFPHSTSFTALFDELGLCRIFDLLGSLLGFYFLHESHITIYYYQVMKIVLRLHFWEVTGQL